MLCPARASLQATPIVAGNYIGASELTWLRFLAVQVFRLIVVGRWLWRETRKSIYML